MNEHGAKNSLLLIGGGGHALSVLEAIFENEALSDFFAKIAFVDRQEMKDNHLLGIPYAGTDADLAMLRREYSHAFISVGSVGNWQRRKSINDIVAENNYYSINIVHPAARLSRFSKYETGVYAGYNAFVNAGCEILGMSILNSGCIVEHDCVVGEYAHVAPGAILCGNVAVGRGAHIGAGSVVLQGVKIGDNALIGAGSVVTRDIPANVVAFGDPCRVVRQKDED